MNDKTVIRPGGRRPRKAPAQAPVQPQAQPQFQPQAQPPVQQQPQFQPQAQPQFQPQAQPPVQPQPQYQPQAQPQFQPQAQPPVQQQPQAQSQFQQPGIYGAGTDVIDTVIPLLSMVTSLQSAGNHPDLTEFKRYAVEQIRYFQSINFGLGANDLSVDRELVNFTSYGLCALIDELILNTPWGADSVWTHESLLVLFHQQGWGGEQFFTNLNEMIKRPANNLAVLSLYYVSLELGFLGKYRELPNGLNQLHDIKNHLFNVIRQHQPHTDTTLSPAWQGVTDDRGGIVKYVPFWVMSLVTMGLGLAVFSGFYFSIVDRSDWVDKEVAKFHSIDSLNVVPANLSSLGRARTEYRAAEPDLVKEVVEYYDLLTDLLGDDIDREKVSIDDQNAEIFIKLIGSNMFGSGSDRLSDEFVVIVEKIAGFLADHDVAVNVEGHTDNVPINSLRFASNFALSQARANTVKNLLLEDAADSSKVKATGLAAEQSIASNATAQGRAKNRRVEIVLVK